jgi:hypothetical protein
MSIIEYLASGSKLSAAATERLNREATAEEAARELSEMEQAVANFHTNQRWDEEQVAQRKARDLRQFAVGNAEIDWPKVYASALKEHDEVLARSRIRNLDERIADAEYKLKLLEA